MSLQALLGVVRHLVIERIGVDVNILLISQVALPCGDAETASGGTQQHQNASSEASSRYSHSTGNSRTAAAYCISTYSFMFCCLRSIQFVCTHSVLTNRITPNALKRKLSRCLGLGF